jgi:hypothetical protein
MREFGFSVSFLVQSGTRDLNKNGYRARTSKLVWRKTAGSEPTLSEGKYGKFSEASLGLVHEISPTQQGGHHDESYY